MFYRSLTTLIYCLKQSFNIAANCFVKQICNSNNYFTGARVLWGCLILLAKAVYRKEMKQSVQNVHNKTLMVDDLIVHSNLGYLF